MLQLPAVAAKLHPALEKLEDIIEGLRVSLNSVRTRPEHTLRSELSRVEALCELERLLEELHAERITVLGATYLFWECSTDDVINYEGRTWGGAEQFTSTQVAALCIDSGIDSRRVIVDAGPKPPRYSSEEFDVVVDGLRLKTRAEDRAELDDDLPF
jgi:hypothetical protein